jgi:CheY-like chemotaxis protein
MSPETRRNVLRYGIAIDLVVLASGVGMFLPPRPALLLIGFAAAVLASAWYGGWQGGLTALALSLVAIAALFTVAPTTLLLFAAAMLVAGTALHVAREKSRPREARAVAPVPESAAEIGRRSTVTEESTEREESARSEADFAPVQQREDRDRARLKAEAKSLEKAERQARKREEAERERARIVAEREAAERARLEAEALARAEAERLAQQREEADRERERLVAEREAAERARLDAEAVARAEAERLAKEREEADRERARLVAEREAAERARLEAEAMAREEAQRLAREREEAERERARLAAAREEAERARAEAEAHAREEAARLAKERKEAERERARLVAEREAAESARIEAEAVAREEAERERARIAAEREAVEQARIAAEARAREEHEQLAREREEAERARQEAAARAREEGERLERERSELAAAREAAERERADSEERARTEVEQRLAVEREAMRAALEQQLAAEREALSRDVASRAVQEPAAEDRRSASAQSPKAAPAADKISLVDTLTGWFKRPPRNGPNLTTKRVNGNTTATRRPPSAPQQRETVRRLPDKTRKPRLLFLERRRGTADTVLPRLRNRGVDVTVVERWVDAVDELLRIRPDAFLLDIEHPDFEKAYRTSEKDEKLPIVLTGRGPSHAPPNVRFGAFVSRPYDIDDVLRVAQQALSRPDELLAMQAIQRPAPASARFSAVQTAAPDTAPVPSAPAPPPRVARRAAAPIPLPSPAKSNDEYVVPCYACRADFNAVEADWCSCLAKERSLVCTNCLGCFCKAPPAYKEKFWVEAPPRLFERKTVEARNQGALPANVPEAEVVRPLVLTVEDDADIQAIVSRICANLGYGCIHAYNGQDGLELARAYRPNLVLSDAFMPKLDGREMCRMLKEDPSFADTRMVVMTGLYTDTKYRSEALKRFHVDDYVAKPVSVTDLINILQKHLDGVAAPVQEDLYEMHRQEVLSEEDVALADLLESNEMLQIQSASRPAVAQKPDAYEVCCYNCAQNFDATHAEWCRCVGRDNTVVCSHCGGCFCKAPAPYKERFWIDAPPSLFERKMIGSKRSLSTRANPPAPEVKRPLILLVEDDENVQLIVRTVVTTMGFGFVVGANGQEGLSLAREYGPDLILSDAFMPKLDGREMCRLLKEDPSTSRSKAIIMTGLYTDRKYRAEALDYFKVDDYVAKPLAVDDLIKLFKKHLPQEVATAH